ncbi:hypothetical protein DICSQDRAFT_91904 [Dichomitus squalens LYAD-421 SS1]|uniref:Uncharacterized protein n=1 Tax=Dichomitus squalens (strain LYAD-421) TaxID=732165 RepID=R7SNW5_DICSQ|nr:uncharacterized protein DICSQDRAFT_91904 [Dichomitus squalens LYAD-421 SS1]EJF57623.1 hypothetical protein DICSQDRAFT_91904 [Dichomitus squalens LYAD-421 SS1]
MSDSDLLPHFTPLDELIQVVYQGSARFVVLSSVDDDNWTVHVGLTGDQGRWWLGRWTDKDVRNTVGRQTSSILLESFVENLANAFVQGNITVGDWSPATGADIELVIRTIAKTPIRIPLVELSAEEAAAYATKVFAEIALQAQSRRCRLHPSALSSSTYDIPPKALSAGSSSPGNKHIRRTPSPGPEPPIETKHSSPQRAKNMEKGKERERDDIATGSSKKRKAELEAAEEKIQSLKVELAKTKRKQNALMTTPAKLMPKNGAAAVSRAKGASLANPGKKARKYQALEFESDEE